MHLIFLPFVLAQQSAGTPWKVLIITGLLLIAGVALTVYFFKRFRKSESETEEDWSISRSTLLGVAKPARPLAVAPAEPQPEPQAAGASHVVEASSGSKQLVEQPAAEQEPEPERAVVETVHEPAEPTPSHAAGPEVREEHPGKIADIPAVAPPVEARPREVERQHVTDAVTEPPTEVPSIGAHTIAPPGVTEEEYHQSLHQSPFEEEIWADLDEKHRPVAARGEGRTSRTRREPFEPPRIEPLAPRDRTTASETIQSRRGIPAALRATPPEPSERKRPEEETVESTAPRVSSTVIPAPAHAGMSQPAKSILGLPAEASAGPLVLGDSRRPSDEADIGTLSNYGQERDDAAGHGGTIALAVVILIIAGVLLAYLFVTPFHSSINEMVARARGTAPEEPAKARVFKATFDSTKTPMEATGNVVNVSQETLTDLSVEVKLVRKGGGESDTMIVPVTPSEIPPNTQGTFQFKLDGSHQYQQYGVTRLLGKNGSEVKFVKPDQEK